MSSRRNKALQPRLDAFAKEFSMVVGMLEQKYNLILVEVTPEKVVAEDYGHFQKRMATKKALDDISSADIIKQNL